MLHASESNLPARLGRGLLFLAAVCTVIALFLTVLDGQPGAKFIYSFAIGGCCWLIIDVTRLLLSHGPKPRSAWPPRTSCGCCSRSSSRT
jgi:hypothetical protein